ncbi:serine/threonine protein kinase [Mucilaginibacter sp. SG538B]|uniref:lanthionine synthetase LanC family protein n=1 Tax=Mucilaginibacter sp. SG538B TaxID=2587021 RepID=UPI00159E63A5|nr:lanthionine synthetase LanC family protein [Mucilaginibacter sp. SG538B]NVM66872.1 serine/threonine protein kinase [Mucilaginibacter sp. SG538B]
MAQASIKDSGSVEATPQTAINSFRKEEPGYAFYLREQGISFSHIAPYLISGSPDGIESWLIHISLVRQQFDSYIKPILNLLQLEQLPFAIPADAEQHNNILVGASGFQLTGKVISIYVSPEKDLRRLFNKLTDLTRDLFGPAMPCAYHLTGVIAISYGPLLGNSNTGQVKKTIFYGSAIADSLIALMKTNRQTWPFQDTSPIKPYKESRLLNRQYIPIETFKKEPKGNVIKALKLNSIYNMQWCVLKQGRRHQSFDNSGRDAKDRLKWQYRIHQQLADLGILPKPIAYFELHGDGFFAMEYKESVSLIERAAQLSEGKTWRTMSRENKRTVIGYLLQIVRIIGIFHQEGFVHRDVTAANFIVPDEGQVFAIDIELCYDLRNAAPEPPFTLGTPGYMSPEQAAGKAPSKTDDIYSLGALLMSVLSGVLPNKLNHSDKELLAINLAWFIESSSVVSMIVSCLNRDPGSRPALNDICQVLELYEIVLLTNDDIGNDQFPSISPGTPANVLIEGLKTLCSLMPTFGLAELTILVLFKRYTQSQILDDVLAESINTLLNSTGFIELPELDLHLLAAEISGMESHSAKRAPDFMCRNFPGSYNTEPAFSASISNGLSGKGLKLLYLIDCPALVHDPRLLAGIVQQISTMQQTDGSWTTNPVAPNGKGYRVTGFSHGVAGITYFLLCYYAKYGPEELGIRINAALTWLKNERRSENGVRTWSVSADNKAIDPWLEHGFSGVALTFIKAYEILGVPEYKQIATEVLAVHPIQITSNYSSFGNGLAGLGEIYLEAFRVFGEEAWHLRASAVQGALLNSCFRDRGQCYWLDGAQLEPTADFWSGNAGVLHFLLRLSHPNEINFPIQLIK